MARWYRDGTASVANGATAVTGSACAWAANVRPGDAIRFDGSDRIYEVASVAGNTALTLATPFAGASVVNGAYEIQRLSRDHSLAAELSVRIGQLLDGKAMVLSGVGPPSADIGSVNSFYVDRDLSKWHYRDASGWDAGLPFFGGPQGMGYGGVSASSVAIGTATGTRAFDIGVGYAYEAGARVRVAHDGANYVEGPVVSYARTTTGILTIAPDKVRGAGTWDDWTVSLAGDWPGLPAIAGLDGGLDVLADTPVPDTYTLRSRRISETRTLAAETIADAARARLIVLNRATAMAVALTPAADGWFCYVTNVGAGDATITPASGQINGAATLVLRQLQHAMLAYDGTSWRATVANVIRQQDLDALDADHDAALAAAVASLNGAIAAKLTSPLSAKGDLLLHDGAAPVRFPVGANGLYPRANNAAPLGIEWVPVAPGEFDIAAKALDDAPSGKWLAGTTGSANVRFAVDKIGAGKWVEFFPVGGLLSRVTSGAAAATVDSGTSDTTIRTNTFTATADLYLQGHWKPPPSWDGGDVVFRPVFTHVTTTGQHTSTTSATIGTGWKTFTLNAINQGYQIGQPVYIHSAAVSGAYPNWMKGTVTAYNGTSKVITIDVTEAGGSGTFAAWQIRGAATWEMKAVCLSNRADINSPMGAGVTLVEPVGAPNWMQVSGQSLAVTAAGTRTPLALFQFQVGRLAATHVMDNCPVALSLVGVEIEYTRSKNNEG